MSICVTLRTRSLHAQTHTHTYTHTHTERERERPIYLFAVALLANEVEQKVSQPLLDSRSSCAVLAKRCPSKVRDQKKAKRKPGQKKK